MKVCYFGTYESEKDRNVSLMNILKSNGVSVSVGHMSYWKFKRSGMPLLFLINIFNNLKLIIKFIKFGKKDIIILGSPGEKDILLTKFLNFGRAKIVLDTYPGSFTHKVKKVDGVLAVSSLSKEKICGMGVNDFKVCVIPAEIEKEFDGRVVNNDKFTVCFYGNFNVDDIKFFTDLKERSDFNLKIISNISKEDAMVMNPGSITGKVYNLLNKFRKVQIKDEKIKLEDYGGSEVDNDGVVSTISSSDCVVVMDNGYASVPRKALRVLAMKKPLIIEENSVTSEFFKNKENALLFTSNDLISFHEALDVLKDKTIKEKIGLNGFKLVEGKHSREKISSDLVGFLRSIL